MNNKTKKLATTGMLCALAFIVAAVFRIPVVLFLRYDPKDIVIVIGGFIFGPLTASLIALLVSFIQMLTVSGTGFLGFLMNVISSSAFACTASCIYRKKHRLSGAVIALVCGVICQTGVMLLWNYLLAPLYMGYSRETVAGLLLPAFLPFNLIKGSLNAVGTMFLYKPVVTALRGLHMIEPSTATEKHRTNSTVAILSLGAIILCILFILYLDRRV